MEYLKKYRKNINALKLFTATFFLCFALPLFSQQYNIRFDRLTIEDGLADNYAHGIFMDSKGYMWFSTQDGLSRYDGSTFKNFRQILGDSTSLNFQIAMDIAEDEDGILWIASLGGGLNKYDPVTEKFKAYTLPVDKNSITTGKPFSKVIVGSDGKIWGGTFDMGLYSFDKEKEIFENFPLNDGFENLEQAFRINTVIDIIEDIEDANILWIAGNNGLYSFEKNTKKLTRHIMQVQNRLDTVSSFRCVYMDKPGEVWAGTWTHGLVRFFPKKQKWEQFPHNPAEWEKGNVAVNIVFDIEQKSPSEFWLASKDEGLMSFDIFSKKFTYYKHDPFDGNSILSDDTEIVYKDRVGRIWISNFHKGVSIIDPSNQIYQFTELSPVKGCSPNNIFEAYNADFDVTREKLYVTSIGCGALHIYGKKPDENPVLENSLYVTPDFNAKLNVFVDTKKRVWVAGVDSSYESPYSVFLYDPTTQQIQPFDHPMLDQVPLQSYFINDIIEDENFNIWFATSFGGVFKLDANNNFLKQYIKTPQTPDYPAAHMRIVDINADRKGNIWMSAVNNGLFKFNPNSEEVIYFDDFTTDGQILAHERIMSTAEDKNGKIWVGVEWNGVWVIDPALPVTQNMKHYGTDSGLPGSKVSQIVKDEKGVLWFRTGQGVCWFDEEQNKFTMFGEKGGDNYSSLGNEGMALLKNGDLFVGKINGFYLFNPSKEYINDVPPPVVFTDFMVNNEPREFEKSLNYLEQIKLDYQDNYFSIGFSALNYSHPELNRYAYILEGYDKDWIYPPAGQNRATYTKVGEGTYTFRVKASNNDGVWNDEGASIKIKVSPPLHRTWWAYLIYLAIIVSAVYFIRKYQIKRLLERADNERLKELDSLKTKLYTNITHEFRTPLTVIMGMTEQLAVGFFQNDKWQASVKDEEKNKVERNLSLIQRNSKNLLRLINQLLDLSKLDSGKLGIKWELGDIVVFLQYLSESFHSYAATKKIQLTFYPEVKSLEMDYDAEKIRHIITNLLSNAIKFTPEGGKIYFHVSEAKSEHLGNTLQIKISDTGVGIPGKHLPHIFSRFYQVDDSHTRRGGGTGIGLTLTKELTELLGGDIAVKSEPGKGTAFTVQLPVRRTAERVSPPETKQPESWFEGNGHTAAREKLASEPKATPDKDAPLLLIVEDNPDVAAYIQACLEKRYQVIWAENGQLGIERALETVPDIIISDVMMPEKDGFEMTQFLKNDERTSHIPIILLTAKADIESKIAGLERGADAYLAKPFDKKELLVRVEKLVELRQKLQSRFAGGKAFFKPSPMDKNRPPAAEKEKGIQMEDAFMIKVNAAIEKRLSDADFGVPHLCRSLRLSQSQLYRKIKALTDKSIAAYVRSYRLHRGKEMLQSSDLNISEIAYEVGFSDPAYFSRSFSEEFGVPPNDLRN